MRCRNKDGDSNKKIEELGEERKKLKRCDAGMREQKHENNRKGNIGMRDELKKK